MRPPSARCSEKTSSNPSGGIPSAKPMEPWPPSPGSRRNAVSWAMETKGHSQRRACSLVGIDPRIYRYRSRRPDDVTLRHRLRDLPAMAVGALRFVWLRAPSAPP